MRTNGLTGLSNLQVFGLPASIYNCTGAAYGTAKSFCQIIQQFEVLCAAYTTTAGYQDLSVHDIFYVRYSLYDIQDLNIFVVGNESRIELFDNSLCAFHTLSLLHNARTNGSHLRTEVRTSDGSNCVAAECRTSHQQLVVQLFSARDRVDREIADFQLCAVCGQTGVDSCGYTGT